MKIYTKTGDQGTTGLFAGPRVAKDHPRIAAYGSIDELNAVLGVAISNMPESLRSGLLHNCRLDKILTQLQSDLFSVGAELATPDPDAQGMRLLSSNRITELETLIDSAESELPPLANFILPGGCPTAAQLHFARTVCRTAERELVTLMHQPDVADCQVILIYLNRLGDFLFVLARLANYRQADVETPWHKPV
jgi:cob(I)alamin adenosyltransferase